MTASREVESFQKEHLLQLTCIMYMSDDERFDNGAARPLCSWDIPLPLVPN